MRNPHKVFGENNFLLKVADGAVEGFGLVVAVEGEGVVVGTGIVGDGLVDNIPAIHDVLVARHNGLDVRLRTSACTAPWAWMLMLPITSNSKDHTLRFMRTKEVGFK